MTDKSRIGGILDEFSSKGEQQKALPVNSGGPNATLKTGDPASGDPYALAGVLVQQQTQNTASYKIFQRLSYVLLIWAFISTIFQIYCGQQYFSVVLPEIRNFYVREGTAKRIESQWVNFAKNIFDVVDILQHATQLGIYKDVLEFKQLELLLTPMIIARPSLYMVQLGFEGENQPLIDNGGITFRRTGPHSHVMMQTDLYPSCVDIGIFGCVRNMSLPKTQWYRKLKEVNMQTYERTILAPKIDPTASFGRIHPQGRDNLVSGTTTTTSTTTRPTDLVTNCRGYVKMEANMGCGNYRMHLNKALMIPEVDADTLQNLDYNSPGHIKLCQALCEKYDWCVDFFTVYTGQLYTYTLDSRLYCAIVDDVAAFGVGGTNRLKGQEGRCNGGITGGNPGAASKYWQWYSCSTEVKKEEKKVEMQVYYKMVEVNGTNMSMPFYMNATNTTNTTDTEIEDTIMAQVTDSAEVVTETTTTTPSFYQVYLPDAQLRYKETERLRTYVRAQQFQLSYYSEWPPELPEVVSKLDTQIALDGTSFFWGPAISLLFKLRTPEMGSGGDVTYDPSAINVETSKTNAILGKVTLDSTQFFNQLKDEFLEQKGDYCEVFIVTTEGMIVSAAELSKQVQIKPPDIISGNQGPDMMTFKRVWELPEYSSVQPLHLASVRPIQITQGTETLILIAPMDSDPRMSRFRIVIRAQTAAFLNDVVMAFQITLITLGCFPYALFFIVIVLYAIREKAAFDKIKRREFALDEAKATLGAVNSAARA